MMMNMFLCLTKHMTIMRNASLSCSKMIVLSLWFSLLPCTASSSASYGVDSSFPMHHMSAIYNPDNPLGIGRGHFYNRFIKGCNGNMKRFLEQVGESEDEAALNGCAQQEEDRLSMNRYQPSQMKNFTSAGFAKTTIPSDLLQDLQAYYFDTQDREEFEEWPVENTYVNHWSVPVKFNLIPDELRDAIVDVVQPIVEAWTGEPLLLTSLYGIRIYQRGSVLAPHVDRLPLVSSCILQVHQKGMEEDWPLEVIGHTGVATNVTAVPGDLILYESHSVIHGRPFELKGDSYANIFIHFEPLDYTHQYAMSHGVDMEQEEMEELYEETLQERENRGLWVDERNTPTGVPDYVPKEKHGQWRQDYVYKPDEVKKADKKDANNNKQPIRHPKLSAHTAAAVGNMHRLKEIEAEDPGKLIESDPNGWQPLHEAARSGHKDVLEYLINKGANVNDRTNKGKGGSALFWAEALFDDTHEAVVFLKKSGAKNLKPGAKYNKDDEL